MVVHVGAFPQASRADAPAGTPPPPGAVADRTAIVLVTHNGARYLREQVESVLAQCPPPDSIYLVDDASSDGTVELVRSVVAARADIAFHEVAAPAPTSRDLYTRIAGNFAAGVAAAAPSHRFIALCDQDDVWRPHRLAWQRRRLLETGALATVGDGRLVGSGGGVLGGTLREHFPIPAHWAHTSAGERLRLLLGAPVATGAAMMIDSRLVVHALPVPWGWLHDRWFSLAAATLDALDVDDQVVLDYRVSPHQVVGIGVGASRPASGWAVGVARRPYLAYRKVRDLRVGLRRLAVDEHVRSALSYRGLLGAYVVRRTD